MELEVAPSPQRELEEDFTEVVQQVVQFISTIAEDSHKRESKLKT